MSQLSNVFKPFGSAAISSTGSAVWTPASGKKIVLQGGAVSLLSAGTYVADILEGTAADAGTIASLALLNPGNITEEIPVSNRTFASADLPLGIKVRAGTATIIVNSRGRES
jgi:hypothetical protein